MSTPTEFLQTAPPAVELQNIGPFDRLEILQLDAEFLATSRDELNEAFSLLSFIDTPGGAATHLAEIARHQEKHGADPVKAQIRVTEEYVAYARKARSNRTSLRTLQEELEDMPEQHPFAHLDETRLYTGKGELVRYMDLRTLAFTKDISAFPFSPLRPYTKGQRGAHDPYTVESPRAEVADRIREVLSSTRTHDAKDLVGEAINEQANRYTFWAERVHEIEAHQARAISLVARRSLHELGFRIG
ncbi:MAG: hypothetical protein JWP13_94 [Candidatus Saccharibacteria bacterium]|nr:hypothetical protein [Candidatus Saccharibacteria bacterium]